MQDFLFTVITSFIFKKTLFSVQLFDFLSASSPRFFIGYWILQRGWVSTRPQLLLRVPIASQRPDNVLHCQATIFSSSLFETAIAGCIMDKYPIDCTRGLSRACRSFLKYECPVRAYNPETIGISSCLLYF